MHAQNVSPLEDVELGGLTFVDWLVALAEDLLSSEHDGYMKCPKSMIVQ